MENVILEFDMEEIFCSLLYMAVRKSEEYFIIKVYVKSTMECVHDFYIKNEDMDGLIEKLVDVRDKVKGRVVINDSVTKSCIVFNVGQNSAGFEINIIKGKPINIVKISEFIGYEPFKNLCNIIKSSWKYGEVTDNYDFKNKNIMDNDGIYVKTSFVAGPEPEYYEEAMSLVIKVDGIVSFEKVISIWWHEIKDANINLELFLKKYTKTYSICNLYDSSEINFYRNGDDSINIELIVKESYTNNECEINRIANDGILYSLNTFVGEIIENNKDYILKDSTMEKNN